MEVTKPRDARSELEEQLERAFYLHENARFGQFVARGRRMLGLPKDGLKPIEKAVEWRANHCWEHFTAIRERAYQEDGIEKFRWFGTLTPSGMLSQWRPSLIEPSEGERQEKGLPPAFSEEGKISEWKEKHIRWQVLAQFAPLIDFADRLIEDFALPPFLFPSVQAYIVSNDETFIHPIAASLYVMPIVIEEVEDSQILTVRITGLSALATQEDWLGLWHRGVKPALERRFGELAGRRGRSQDKWARNLKWQRARRRENRAINEILQEEEAKRPSGVKFLDETTVGKAIARVDERMRPIGEETRRILDLFEGVVMQQLESTTRGIIASERKIE